MQACAPAISKPPLEVATAVRVEKREIPLELSSCATVAAPVERDVPLESDLVNLAIDYQNGYLDCKKTLGRLVRWLNEK